MSCSQQKTYEQLFLSCSQRLTAGALRGLQEGPIGALLEALETPGSPERRLSWTPEGQSDLYFTGVFEHFMFRFFIVLRGLMSPHGAQHGPNMGPKRAPKSTQIRVGD